MCEADFHAINYNGGGNTVVSIKISDHAVISVSFSPQQCMCIPPEEVCLFQDSGFQLTCVQLAHEVKRQISDPNSPLRSHPFAQPSCRLLSTLLNVFPLIIHMINLAGAVHRLRGC